MEYSTRSWYRPGMISLVTALGLTWAASAEAQENSAAESQQVIISEEGSSVSETGQEDAVSMRQADPEEADISEQEAIEKLQTVLPVLKEAEADQVELRYNSQPSSSGEKLVWSIHWNYQKANTSYGFSSEVDANSGDILHASVHGPLMEEEDAFYPPEISEEEAVEKAKKTIRTAAPSVDMEELELDNSQAYNTQSLFGTVGYSMNFVPYIDGVPVSGEEIRVEMTGAGELTSFQNRLQQNDYPSAEPEISEKEAVNKFKEDVNLTLSYFTINQGREEKVFLGWKPDENTSSMYLDAVENEYLNSEGELLESGNSGYEELEKEAAFEPITPGENGRISEEQALAAVTEYTDIEENDEPDNVAFRENPNNYEDPVWELRWHPQTPQDGTVQATVNAQSGQILSINQYSPGVNADEEESQEANNGLSKEELKEKAVSYLASLYPDAGDHFKLAKNNTMTYLANNGDSTFEFQRFESDIPVQNDRVYMTLNGEGDITQYRVNITPGLTDKIDGLRDEIGKEAAAAEFDKEIKAKLQFQAFPLTASMGTEEPELRLTYLRQISDQRPVEMVLDAETGEWRSPVGTSLLQNPQQPERSPEDIEGHEAEDALQTLVEYNVLAPDSEGNIHPNEEITYGNWLQIAGQAVSPDYNRVLSNQENKAVKNLEPDEEYYKAVRFADEQGWLDEEVEAVDVDSTLTKEQLLSSMIRILGYDQFATHMEEEPPFDDAASIENKGAVNTALQLGLINNDGSFHPEQEITRAEAAVHMMNLVDIQDSIDQRIQGNRYR
ncbi:YcdB/YcdC domain-containing protein [Salibacterium aidingense]|uniref:YcdB/YcdC domain-containing protein n=1 Tax=Salibacterium aidingense TaxID=384933 RepID=UPI0003F51F4A|nr:S-layer homology domain-containing protein [Salibacterium aidingense]